MSKSKNAEPISVVPSEVNELEKSNKDLLNEKLKQDLVVFDPIKAEAQKLIDIYLKLEVKNAFDKVGRAEIKKARLDLVKRRTGGDKVRKGIVEGARKYVTGVNDYWKPIELLLQDAESKLSEKEIFWEKEFERLEKEKYDGRVNRLLKFGMLQNATSFFYESYYITFDDVRNSEDHYFDKFVSEVAIEFEKVENEKKFLSDWDQAIGINNKMNADALAKREKDLQDKLDAIKLQEEKNNPKPVPAPEPPATPKPPAKEAPKPATSSSSSFGGPAAAPSRPFAGNTETKAPTVEREFLLRRSQVPPNNWVILQQDKGIGTNVKGIAEITRNGKDIMIKTFIDTFTLDELIKITGALHGYRDQI